jgi:hypothetical protein
MGRFIIDYKGDIKTLKRLCQRVQELPELGTEHDQAYYGDLGQQAYEHSLIEEGNPHHVTADDLGLGNVLNQIRAIMVAIGMLKVWATHNDEPIADHEGVYLSFHGVSAPDVENNLLWH